jgi:four helix bundle protein
MMVENTGADKSFQFAVRIVRLYQFMCEQKKEYVLSKQLLRSGTSIGANVSEAQQAQSRLDFLSKMNIALKEASETEYWLRLLHKTDFLDDKQAESMTRDCEEIKKLLHSIVKTTSDSSRRNAHG